MHEFKAIEGYTVPDGRALLLRTCAADMTAHGGFVWPGVGGTAVAPDWDPAERCGGGLHGALWGEGDGRLLSFDADAVWMCVEVDAASVVSLGGKVKAPSALVVCTGGRHDVTAWLATHRPGAAIIGGTAAAGDYGTAAAGDYGTLVIRRLRNGHYRLSVGYVGETRDAAGAVLRAGVTYRLDAAGAFVEAQQ